MDLGKWCHDLKNQLGIVVGFSELLLNDLDPNDRHRADVEEIHAAAQRALLVVSQMTGAEGDES